MTFSTILHLWRLFSSICCRARIIAYAMQDILLQQSWHAWICRIYRHGSASWYFLFQLNSAINVSNITPQRGKIWKLRKTFQVCDKNCSPVDSKKSRKVGFFCQGARIWSSLFVSAWMNCFLHICICIFQTLREGWLVMILARLESWSLARVSPPVTTFQLDPCSSFCQPVEYNSMVL